jgi:hypothetical protein
MKLTWPQTQSKLKLVGYQRILTTHVRRTAMKASASDNSLPVGYCVLSVKE